ncbi:hypothetical protein BDV96DRAFT_648103 [Lophiotrema nucula]|uniref:Uncharacterized protein n=1 Tax=Lophiotrema nucula TaxID=690887 RepID=A0A6A5Z4C7_9PLEO|nr:hypothetical protein BDV96DRAFT_648103 [Lophiotrema nucula]
MFPFLNLPRELRDQLYNAYLHNEDGLFYLYGSKEMQYANTAVAIGFLSELSIEESKGLRATVVIKEDRKGVAYPETHTKGLLPYYHENPHLRFETHLAIWPNLVPAVWLPYICYGAETAIHAVKAESFLIELADWVEETTFLEAANVPAGSMTFVLEGRRDETLHVWDFVKRAVSMQEAMFSSLHCSNQETLDPTTIIYPYTESIDQQPLSSWRRLQLPSDPRSFYSTIKNIVHGIGNIRFDGDLGSIWNSDEAIANRKDWSLQEFWNEFYELRLLNRISFPPGGIPAYFRACNLVPGPEEHYVQELMDEDAEEEL